MNLSTVGETYEATRNTAVNMVFILFYASLSVYFCSGNQLSNAVKS